MNEQETFSSELLQDLEILENAFQKSLSNSKTEEYTHLKQTENNLNAFVIAQGASLETTQARKEE